MQRLAPSVWRRPTRAVHLPSVALVVVAALSLVAGSATIGRGTIGYLALGAGLSLAAGFVVLQRRLDHPLVDVDALIGNFALRSALSVQLLLYMNAFSSIFMLSIYMQVSLDRSAATTGRALAIGSVIMALMAPVAGILADRYRPRTISSYGVTAVLLAALLALTLDDRSGLTPVIAVLAIQGLGFALFSSPNQTIIVNSVPEDSVSMASALGATARSIGMLSGMLVTAMLISHSIGNDPIDQHPLTFVGTMRTAFWVLAGLSVVALGVSLTTRTRARG
jgi:MFS family permease